MSHCSCAALKNESPCFVMDMAKVLSLCPKRVMSDPKPAPVLSPECGQRIPKPAASVLSFVPMDEPVLWTGLQ